jgi:hypothetical protein
MKAVLVRLLPYPQKNKRLNYAASGELITLASLPTKCKYFVLQTREYVEARRGI